MRNEKPKLTLAPPPPALRLDTPMKLSWSDGSSLTVTPDGTIILVEPMARYALSTAVSRLSLVVSEPAKLQQLSDALGGG